MRVNSFVDDSAARPRRPVGAGRTVRLAYDAGRPGNISRSPLPPMSSRDLVVGTGGGPRRGGPGLARVVGHVVRVAVWWWVARRRVIQTLACVVVSRHSDIGVVGGTV